ncbi:MAG: glycosyltransferase family 4 protein [Armatimonadetes bacterium]|nr:glycosyltransferase family 4 protein [Armatimonadota bacterium]
MKVLQVVRNRQHGGPAQHVLVLARELSACADVTVACQSGSWIADRLRDTCLPATEVRIPGSIMNPFSAAKLALYARRNRVDVIHGHGDCCAMYAKLAATACGGLSVSTVHSLVPNSVRWTSRCDSVIAVSEATADVLKSRGVPGGKLRVVRHGVPDRLLGVDRDECRWRIRQEFGIQLTAPLAVAVGKADRLKGHDLFFEAAAVVRRTLTDACFMLLGGRSDGFSPVIDAIVAKHSLSSVTFFPGHRYDAVDVFAAADVVVLPSRSESLSQTAIEAQAVGTPVVASRVGGLPEVVADGETGILVESEDVDALAEAMLSLFLDPAMAGRLGSAGKQRVESQFLARTMAEKTLAVYREVMAR